ncbi:hypothetical protein [Sulfurimonas sp.]|uniref:hypothetical protein n=1 Tax=Sulfurimonas sp. TaxID=2022749 RepID=UPI003D0D26BA
MVDKYKEFYKNNFSTERYKNYQEDFKDEIGKVYSLSTSPAFITKENAQKIQEKILPAILKLVGSKQYQDHIYERGWFLPKFPIANSDFFGCADFHLNDNQIKLIELNFFIPGHFGLIELFTKLFSKNFNYELEPYAKGFEKKLANFLQERFNGNKIALAVNHLGLSQHYFEHYKYVEKFLNQNGVNAKVVYAKDAKISNNNKPMWDNEEFDGVFNIVIPRIWEHNAKVFENYTQLFNQIPKLFFPNPWCWTMADKRFLVVLSNLQSGDFGLSDEEVAILKSITLKSSSLAQFHSAEDLCEYFGGNENLVLKPIDNYHTQGVYVKPSIQEIENIFKNQRDQYIAQEYFGAELAYYKDENEHEIKPWRSQLRVEFFNGKFLNFRAYGYSDPFGLSPMMPVAIV